MRAQPLARLLQLGCLPDGIKDSEAIAENPQLIDRARHVIRREPELQANEVATDARIFIQLLEIGHVTPPV